MGNEEKAGALIEVELLGSELDEAQIGADLTAVSPSVSVRRVPAEAQGFVEWLMPAIVTIKAGWPVIAPYLVATGGLLWRVGTDAIALAVLMKAATAIQELYRKARASNFSWQGQRDKKKRPAARMRIELTLPDLPGVQGRRIVGILPDGLTDAQVKSATDTIVTAFRIAEEKRQQELETAEKVAELIRDKKEEEAIELHITTRETLHDWTFIYHADKGWLDANVELHNEPRRARGEDV